MAKGKAEKIKSVKITTPMGRLSYPFLNEPDSGREFSDNKYKTDFLIPKDIWKTEGKELKDAVLFVGREFFKDKTLELSDFKNPFKDTDKLEKYSSSDEVKNCVLLRCKSVYKPIVVGPHKTNGQWADLPEEERKKIKGGDYCKLVVAIYPYGTGDGGVTLGLNLVQFVKPGDSLGGGRAAALAQLEEIEIEPDEIDNEEKEVDDEEPKKEESKKKNKAPVKEDSDDSEDDSGESDDTGEESEDDDSEPSKKKRGQPAGTTKKKNEKINFDDDDEDDAF